jgi:hypothetical protein
MSCQAAPGRVLRAITPLMIPVKMVLTQEKSFHIMSRLYSISANMVSRTNLTLSLSALGSVPFIVFAPFAMY